VSFSWLVENLNPSLDVNFHLIKKYFASFVHLHSYEKKIIQPSAAITTKEVFAFLKNTKIPTQKECNVIEKI